MLIQEHAFTVNLPVKNIIQIAGVIDEAEAEMLIAAGVDWLGFPLRLIMHKEDLPENDAAKIIRSIVTPKRGVLIWTKR